MFAMELETEPKDPGDMEIDALGRALGTRVANSELTEPREDDEVLG